MQSIAKEKINEYTGDNTEQISFFDNAENSATRSFAVLDTETNWNGQLMSIGIVVARDTENFPITDSKYFVLTPEFEVGGIYEDALSYVKKELTTMCSREAAVKEILQWLGNLDVDSVFAYNARFDLGLLPELANFRWFDIMRLAAYRQFNPKIPQNAECFSTGRLRKGFGVQSVMRMFVGENYFETHNALIDAADELTIMRLLRHDLNKYIELTK